MRHRFLALLAVASLIASGIAVAAAMIVPAAAQPAGPVLYGCVNQGGTGTESHEIFRVHDTPVTCPSGSVPVSWQGLSFGNPSPSPSVTTPTATPTPTPTPSPSSTSSICSVPLGQNCGPFFYPQIPMSNGFDTYVANQNVGANSTTTENVMATDPGSWQVTADALPLGYTGVQTFPDVQQLTNDWCGTGWGGCASPTDTPLNSLTTLSITYSETSPTGPNDIYEFAPDIWSEGYASDIMFWADTHGRCDPGAYGGTILAPAVVIDGQTWTVNRYGGAGAEIIFVLDSNPAVPDSCAQQSSGTIDIKAGLDWLVANGFIPGPEVLTQVNTGWEITSADNSVFTMNSYGITAG